MARINIAYKGSPKRFPIFGNGLRILVINQLCIISIIYAKKDPKMWCLVIFLGLTQRFDSILHILIVVNGPQDLVMVLARFCIINYS